MTREDEVEKQHSSQSKALCKGMEAKENNVCLEK